MGFLEDRDLSDVPDIPEFYKGKTIFITGGSGKFYGPTQSTDVIINGWQIKKYGMDILVSRDCWIVFEWTLKCNYIR